MLNLSKLSYLFALFQICQLQNSFIQELTLKCCQLRTLIKVVNLYFYSLSLIVDTFFALYFIIFIIVVIFKRILQLILDLNNGFGFNFGLSTIK